MLELTYIDNILTFEGVEYTIVDLRISTEFVVFVTIQNEMYFSVIALVANETTINEVLQKSAQQIIDSLKN
jgi:hypothetical protein